MRNLDEPIILSLENARRGMAAGALIICGLTFTITGWAGNEIFKWKQAELIRELNEAHLRYDILASKSDPFAVVMAEKEFEQELKREAAK
jgi:hypothetical protein